MFLSSLLMFTMYSAFLTSFLSVFKLQMPFDDLYDLYLSTDYKVAAMDESATTHLLKTGSVVEKKIYTTLIEGTELANLDLYWSYSQDTDVIKKIKPGNLKCIQYIGYCII